MTSELQSYRDFLRAKIACDTGHGVTIDPTEIHPLLKPHQRDIVQWAVAGGRRAIFAKFGLGKSMIELETLRLCLKYGGGDRGLIVAPLGVRQEFKRDAEKIGLTITFVRRTEEVGGPGLYITNYESVRDGKLDVGLFDAISLDEASCLRGFGGTKTFREFMRLFEFNRKNRFRFVATATPSPNDYIELLAYAGFLEVMDIGEGKAQPLDASILTPRGWKRMGAIKVGDKVIAGDGTVTRVVGVYPQGEREIFRVTFSDGGSTEADAEHLWLTRTQYERNNERRYVLRNGEGARRAGRFATARTTANIRATLKAIQGNLNHSIPVAGEAQFGQRPTSIDPWLLGFLLGDGCLRPTSVVVSTADEWAVRAIEKALPTGLHLRRKTAAGCDYGITGTSKQGGKGPGSNPLLLSLRRYGLLGKRSWEKQVPKAYLFNSTEVRLGMLRGLMDSDGTVDDRTGPSFSTTSRALADDVRFLVRSLGGVASIRGPFRTAGRDAFTVTITMPAGRNPFALPRKANVWIHRKFKPKQLGPRRYIVSVEPIGTKPAQCIAIDHPSRLYVTDDFIVTHNTRFFKRDSTKADHLTLHAHKEAEFWAWMNSWAIFLQRPSDLGHSDAGYDLPPLAVHWHRIAVDHKGAGEERDGQKRMFRDAALGLQDAAREKRSTLDLRVGALMELVTEVRGDQIVIWCDLNDEQRAIEKALDDAGISYSSMYGSQSIDEREALITRWLDRETVVFLSKPIMYGAGVNLQQSHTMIFAGIGFKAQDTLQAIHRIHRFLQANPCHVHLIYAASEAGVKRVLERKWRQHEELTNKMSDIIRQYGLSHRDMISALARSIGSERVEVIGRDYTLVNNDCVEEALSMPENSVDLIVSSLPFSTQYEYTPSYNDFGHTDNNAHFWAQMDFLTPQLLRVLQPGRVAAIHVKDRITPGGINGFGFQTVEPFSDECVAHFRKHGFAFLARKTIVTDVVRENNQTYRLGWTEQCKDGSRMGAGMPEYVLLFRKPPTDRSNGYADKPVVKSKPACFGADPGDGSPPPTVPFDRNGAIVPGSGYSRSRWQIDAHGFSRSSGNRLLVPEEIANLTHEQIFKLFRRHSLTEVYDFEHHVRIGEELEMRGILPVTFMLLQPQSWHPDVWTDITRMRTLNGVQHAKGKELHLCPLQLDCVDRLIAQFSMPGETVFDPFGGLMTVPYCAIKQKRKGIGVELNPGYFLDGAGHCAAAEREMSTPTLFDLLATERPAESSAA